MTTADLPATVLLLLPGYVAVRFFFWRSHWRTQSDLELVLGSLGAAFLLLGPLAFVWHEAWNGPTFQQLIQRPSDFPRWMPLVLFVLAPVLGTALGWADRSGGLALVLRPVGIDLRRREDVWWTVFNDERWCIVYLSDGTVLYGWPSAYSRDRRDASTELYLSRVAVRQDDGTWRPVDDDIDGVWLDARNISRIAVTIYDLERSAELLEGWDPL